MLNPHISLAGTVLERLAQCKVALDAAGAWRTEQSGKP
jgi:hypothetical protein